MIIFFTKKKTLKKLNCQMNKNNSQLNLHFKDSSESKKHNKNLDIRINILISSFLIFSLLIIFKLLLLGFDKKDFFTRETFLNESVNRRSIVDRNNNIIAHNLKTYDLLLRSSKVKNFDNLKIKLKINFLDINFDEIEKNKNKSFYIIKKNLSPVEFNKVLKLGEPSLELVGKETRIYPNKNLFSHIIGNIDVDQNGISGVEYYFNNHLLEKNKINDPLTLSLDLRVQYQIRNTLLEGMQYFKAKGASAVLMDSKNGEIISMVSLPDFNPNDRSIASNRDNYFNKNTKGLYEMGSVFKVFAIANGIEQKKIKRDQVFSNLPSRVYCGKFPIDEYRYAKDKKNLSVNDILVKSSNIGTIRIIQEAGLESYQQFLENLELFNTPTVEVPEVATSIKKRWGKCRTLTAGFGHGISTSPVQLTRAYASIVNGGELLDVTLLKNEILKKSKKVISEETSSLMTKILRTNVDRSYKVNGSGRKADIDGYDVEGKTGTAEKPSKNQKGYSKDIMNIFTSSFLVNDRRYVLTVIYDEPKGSPELWGHSRRESGWNAAYTNGQIIKKIGPILNTLKIQKFAKLN